MSSDGNYNPFSLNWKPPNTGLREKTEQKKKQEQAILENVLCKQTEKYGVTIIEGTEIKNVKQGRRLNEGLCSCRSPMCSSCNTSSGSSKEGEPSSVTWIVTNPQAILRAAAQAKVISDVLTTMQGALQQKEMPFALLTNQGTAFLIKSDRAGSLYMSQPSKQRQHFANIGLAPDYDNDEDDVHGSLPAKPLGESRLEEKRNWKQDIESLPDRQKNTINELLNLANNIRSGAKIPEPTPRSRQSQVLMESKKPKTNVDAITEALLRGVNIEDILGD